MVELSNEPLLLKFGFATRALGWLRTVPPYDAADGVSLAGHGVERLLDVGPGRRVIAIGREGLIAVGRRQAEICSDDQASVTGSVRRHPRATGEQKRARIVLGGAEDGRLKQSFDQDLSRTTRCSERANQEPA